MNDLVTFLNSLQQQPTPQSQIPDPGSPGFTQWLLQNPQVPRYTGTASGGSGGGGTSGLGSAIGSMIGGGGVGAGGAGTSGLGGALESF